ncbi:MAG: hypothetical protein PWQ71_842 [Bacteroidota bacterium]|jgi:hypothetical protein|nr:hypothetical protein [Bacteroidota bacterium]
MLFKGKIHAGSLDKTIKLLMFKWNNDLAILY